MDANISVRTDSQLNESTTPIGNARPVDLAQLDSLERKPEEGIARVVDSINRIGAVHKILEVVCRMTGLGFSAVARVTETQWIACAVRDEIAFGLLPGAELQIATTICNEIRESGQAVVIDHASEDDVFCGHPTPKLYGFESYISVPITLASGHFFGTLCAIDPRPAKVNTPEIIGMFHLFADLIAMHIDAEGQMAASSAALLSEREAAKLREQFIAVLGHDLRNPLAAIQSGSEVLGLLPQTPDGMEVIGTIKRSVARITELIDNVLDLARGRLGGGISYYPISERRLGEALGQVVRELQIAWPERVIHWECAIETPVVCDSARISQMLSNLLANALAHGDRSSPIRVNARTGDGAFEMSVANEGTTIPPEVMANLFEPFARGEAVPGNSGLGLGLYIASEIARVHKGQLTVESAEGKTCFSFRMAS
ncbi:MAG: GAF domain-containing sensor histidine kinase [Chlorobia bacterium]|nr:GAF domain-containing sensor histidine kinase [Fimbriimonadaceae bacterium]